MGVGEDFAAFKDNYNVSSELISSISYRYRRITRQLNTDFWNTTSETAHSLYVGSYGRDTAAKGVSDLDVAFVLPYSQGLAAGGEEIDSKHVPDLREFR